METSTDSAYDGGMSGSTTNMKCMDSSDYNNVSRDSAMFSASCLTESEIDISSSTSSSSHNLQNNPLSSYHRLDSGVDVAEGFSGLNISCSSIPEERTISVSVPGKGELSLLDTNEYPPWEQFFLPDEDGDTQLHIGIVEGYMDGVFTLISLVPHPSILDFQNDACQTALHLAVLTKQPRVVRRLVVAGARVDMRDRFGNTPLHLAAASGDLGSVNALTLALTASETEACCLRYPSFAQPLPQALDLLNYEGLGPIHLAAISGHTEVLRTLHWLKANIHLQEAKGGRSALHLAIERGHSHAVRVLVEDCNASLESRTYGGLTPYQLASDGSRPTIAEILLTLGAIPEQDSLENQRMESDDESSSDSESESDFS